MQKLYDELREEVPMLRMTIAPTLGAAWGYSRFGKERFFVIHKEEVKSALSPLPLAALRISKKSLDSLLEMKLNSIGHLLEIPRKELLKRFDREVSMRVNQVLGIEEEVFEAVAFTRPRVFSQAFEIAITDCEALSYVCRELLKKLTESLSIDSIKISALFIEFTFEDASTQRKEITLSVPSSSFSHLWKVIAQQLETLSLRSPVTRIALGASSTKILYPEQAESSFSVKETTPPSAALGELIDTLSNHLGAERVLRMHTKASYLPERALVFKPAGNTLMHPLERGAPVITSERPSMLFYKPKPIRALAALPDSPPAWLKWNEQTFTLVESLGPERITPEWWGADTELTKTRDYFKVQLPNGTWLWIYRDHQSSEWFVHGAWV